MTKIRLLYEYIKRYFQIHFYPIQARVKEGSGDRISIEFTGKQISA